jgi:hypothetical protein
VYSLQREYLFVHIYDITLGRIRAGYDLGYEDFRPGWITPDGRQLVYGNMGRLVAISLVPEIPSGISIFYYARQVVGIPGSNTDFVAVSGEYTNLSVFRMKFRWVGSAV